jgi:hypothetical protein
MSFKFSEEHIEKISNVLGREPVASGHSWVWHSEDKATGQKIILSIYDDVAVSQSNKGALVSVQSVHGYSELHDISDFMIFDPDEIIFIRYDDEYVSLLVVGRKATTSLYSNISRDLLKLDLTELDSPVLLSAMQIAIAESLMDK